jgi:integrase
MSVRKHHGSYQYRTMKNGILYTKSGYKTEDEAKFAEAHIKREAKLINTDFTTLCQSRLDDVELNRTPKHFIEVKQLIDNLKDIWRQKKEITRKDIEDFMYDIAITEGGDTGKKMANKRLKLIRALFNHGIERGLIYHNPAKGIKPFSVTPKKRYVPPLSQLETVIANAGELKPYLIAIKNTLGRASEINKLKWEDVNLEEQWLTLSTRKSKNSDLSYRNIDINDELFELLESLPMDNDLVFPCHAQDVYFYRLQLLRKICRKFKFKFFGFHAFRHYGASKLAEAGLPITQIQYILGHQRATTTDIYLRSLRPNLRSAMELL